MNRQNKLHFRTHITYSVVGLATRLWPGRSEVRFPKLPRPALGSTHPYKQLVRSGVFPRVKRPGSKADHPLPFNAQRTNEPSSTSRISTPLFAFMTCTAATSPLPFTMQTSAISWCVILCPFRMVLGPKHDSLK